MNSIKSIIDNRVRLLGPVSRLDKIESYSDLKCVDHIVKSLTNTYGQIDKGHNIYALLIQQGSRRHSTSHTTFHTPATSGTDQNPVSSQGFGNGFHNF